MVEIVEMRLEEAQALTGAPWGPRHGLWRRGDDAVSMSDWLVVWNMNFIFPEILGIIIPIDFHIFQRGGPTTNQNRIE